MSYTGVIIEESLKDKVVLSGLTTTPKPMSSSSQVMVALRITTYRPISLEIRRTTYTTFIPSTGQMVARRVCRIVTFS